MASLYDLEVQESNNLIHAFIHQGETPELARMRRELEEARRQAPEKLDLVNEYLDQESPLGSRLKRYTELESDIKLVMQINGLTSEIAQQADQIFSKQPMTFSGLSDDERQKLTTYWLKKKTCLADLLRRGYTHEEIFSIDYYKPIN